MADKQEEEEGEFTLIPRCGTESLGKHDATQGAYKSEGYGKG